MRGASGVWSGGGGGVCVWCAVCGGGGASLSCSMGIPTLDRLFFIKGVPG